MPNRAIFLDRDGTLNEDPGYISDPELVKLFPETSKALSILKKNDFLLIVISNQSGIARGIMKKEDVERVNSKINSLLLKNDVQIDGFYYCPAHPDFSSDEECTCRKPSPKLVFEAAKDFNIDLKKSYFIGDAVSDIKCGKNAGLKTVLVKTGQGVETFSILQKENNFPSFIAENILVASNYILDDSKRSN